MVSLFAFYFDDPSSNLAEAYIFSNIFCLRPGLVHLKTTPLWNNVFWLVQTHYGICDIQSEFFDSEFCLWNWLLNSQEGIGTIVIYFSSRHQEWFDQWSAILNETTNVRVPRWSSKYSNPWLTERQRASYLWNLQPFKANKLSLVEDTYLLLMTSIRLQNLLSDHCISLLQSDANYWSLIYQIEEVLTQAEPWFALWNMQIVLLGTSHDKILNRRSKCLATCQIKVNIRIMLFSFRNETFKSQKN